MKLLNIVLQGEEIMGEKHLVVDTNQTAGSLKHFLAESRRYETGDSLFLFKQDSQYPLSDDDPIPKATDGTTRVHLHSCRYVQVSVVYQDRTISADYGPGTTIAKIMAELVRLGFGLNQKELNMIEPRLVGTHTRVKPSTHVGSFVRNPYNQLALELMIKRKKKMGPVKNIKQRYSRRFSSRK